MAIPALVVGAAAAVAATPAVIDGIKRALDALGFDRSCIVEIVNTTGERLRLVRTILHSGTFGHQPAPFVEPYSTVVFSARSTAAGRGAVGDIAYEGPGFTIFMDYSNPFVGDNDLDATVRGDRAGDFVTLCESGSGHTNARFRCVIYYKDQNQYVQPTFFKFFRSVNFRDRFIRHENFRLVLAPAGQSDDFMFDVVVRRANAERTPELVGLRSVNFPDRFIRHRNFEIWLEPPAGGSDALWGQDSTFHLETELVEPNGVSFRSVNAPDRYIRHRNFKLYLEPLTSDAARRDASFLRY